MTHYPLPAVSPPTDWFGIGFVILIGLVMVVVAGVILWALYVRRTPGTQFGEEELEWVAERLHQKATQKDIIITTTDPLFYDGEQFESQAALDEYKAAQAVIAKRKGKT